MEKDVLAFAEEKLRELKEENLYNTIRVLESSQGAWVTIDGREKLNLCSNNYLGLAADSDLIQAACDATEKYGVGPGAVRSIAGTMSIHLELEKALAEFKGREASVVVQSGFSANLAVIPLLVGPDDLIYSDELNHASIIDGCRLSRAKIRVFRHLDMEHLEELLREDVDHPGRKLIISDGVFSMDGDLANLPGIADLAEKYGCMSMVDDAHGEGVLGSHGRGLVNHYDLGERIDVEVGTLSKALGCVGGFIAGDARLVEYIKQRGRPFLFSSSLTPAEAAANLAAVRKLGEKDDLVTRLWENAEYFQKSLREMGFDTGRTQTPITPVMIGDAGVSSEFSRRLFERDIFAQSIGFPTVPEGKARIRVMISAAHSRDDLDFALKTFGEVGRDLDLI